MRKATAAWAALATVFAALLAACAQPLLSTDHPLAGRIWDVRAGAFIEPAELWKRAAAVRHLLIGEVHDNPVHHRQQLAALEALAGAHQRGALAMEQFDSEHQAVLDGPRLMDAEMIADAGRFDREGWDWPLYRPLVAFAVKNGWPLLAANLSRAEARKADAAFPTLPPPGPDVQAALERDMVDGHCGHKPDAKTLAFMVATQRARDARMADVITRSPKARTVLIAGNGHVRRDRGVPLYLRDASTLVIGQLEVRPETEHPGDYFRDGFATARSYDYVWFTPRAVREDPCERFRR